MFDFEEAITKLIKGMLIDNITVNLEDLLKILNENVVRISDILAESPQSFNGTIFSFVKSINDNVMLPIVGIIITAIFCVNIIHMVTKKNRMQDVESFDIYKLIFTTYIWVWLLSRAFKFVLAIFDVSAKMITDSMGIINSNTSLNIDDIDSITSSLNDLKLGELVMISGLVSLAKLIIFILSIVILVVCYVRIIEIYLYASVSSLAFSTLGSDEYGNIGKNYIKNLIALGLQAVLIIVCVGIYSALITNITFDSNIEKTIGEIFLYTFILGSIIFKTNSIAKSIATAS